MIFRRQGSVMLDPSACGFDFTVSESRVPLTYSAADGVATVSVRGPLSHHAESWDVSYDEIASCVAAALADSAVQVVYISGDTPGGDVSGCFSTARILRQRADAAGKKLVWYVDGQTCSAGLALAVACDVILVPPEARIGSIGVIAELVSQAAAVAAQRVDCRLIVSGARKSDGHPCAMITDDTVAAVQSSVDVEAQLFFSWVSERRGIAVDTIASWNAQVFHGQEAVSLGIADRIANDAEAYAFAVALAGDNTMGAATNKAASSLDDARKMLGDLSGEDSDEGRKARKALDALDAEDAEDEDPKPSEPDAPHKEPDGDEGAEDDGDSDGDSDAEDDGDSDAEDDGDSDAETEEARAKAASSAAVQCVARAKVVLRRGGSKAAVEALRLMHKADCLRAEAKNAKRFAAVFRASAKAVATAMKRSTPTHADALAGARASGTSPAAPAKSPLSSVPQSMLVAAGLARPASAIDISGASGIGLVSPEEAARIYKETQAAFSQGGK
jgi:ClpP class serine protease